MKAASRRHFLGLDFDGDSFDQIANAMAARDPAQPFAYLVTPNVDHMVRLHEEKGADRDAVLASYREAGWCTCDSRILAMIARLRGVELPIVTGSDLTATLLDETVQPGDRIALVGGAPSTIAGLRRLLPAVDIVEHQPPMGLRDNPAAIAAAAAFIADTRARFTFLAVGSPQQELVALAAARRGDASGIGLCIGAAIEFVVGEQRRAPRFVQQLRLEWAFRLASNPRRLWRRYLVKGPRIFRIALADARRGRRRG